jgi:hypothetical protein
MTSRMLFRNAIDAMEAGFEKLEVQVPPPRVVRHGGGVTLRYVEQTIQQAILLKLARQISGLNACDILLASGYVQEQGVIQRTLDELDEDILFLCFGAQDGTVKLHRKYLKSFWQEEFEEGVAPIDSTKGRYHIARGDIRDWLGRRLGTPEDDPSMKALRVVQQTYSGYVHAASPHIMDMCGGPQRRFHLRGMNGTPRITEHVQDFWNYVYRGLLSVNTVALIFGDAKASAALRVALTNFEEASGSTFMADAAKE